MAFEIAADLSAGAVCNVPSMADSVASAHGFVIFYEFAYYVQSNVRFD